MTYEIFICYETTTGGDFAEILQKAFKKNYIKSFFAPSDLIAGEEWSDERDLALEQAQFFVILVTYNTFISKEVIKEYNQATKLKKWIIPCIYKRISADKVQTLKNKHQIYFKNTSELTNDVLTTIDEIKIKIDEGNESENDIEELWRRGDLLYELNQLKESLEVFISISELNPRIWEPLNNIGIILNSLNRFEEALEYFERALNISSASNCVSNNKAISLLGLSKLQEAKNLVNNNIALNPEDGIAWSIKGIILEKLGQTDESKRITKKAFELNNNIPEILNNYALNLVKDGLFNDAIKIYDEALELNPNFILCLFNRGIAFEKIFKFQEAFESYEKYLKHDKNNANVWSRRGIALGGLGRFDEAKKSLDKALKIDNLNLVAMSCKALVLKDLGDIKNAEILIGLALEEDENHPDALLVKGKLLNASKKYDKALKYLNKAENNYSESYAFYLEKGYSLLMLNQLDKAEKYYTAAIQLGPQLADGWYNRACVYSLMKNKKAALKDLLQAIEINPDYKITAFKDDDFKDMLDDNEFKQLVNN